MKIKTVMAFSFVIGCASFMLCRREGREAFDEVLQWIDCATWSSYSANGELEADFGILRDGVFEPIDRLTYFEIESEMDLDTIIKDSADEPCMYCEFDLPHASSSMPLKVVRARIVPLRVNGMAFNDGITVAFDLVDQNWWYSTYRSQKPIFFVSNPAFEGERATRVVLFCEVGGSAKVFHAEE